MGTGSSTDRRTSRTVNSAKSLPTDWTTKCVRISRDSRRSVPTGVFVTTGVSACADNTRRRPDDVAALLVSPRRREANFQIPLNDDDGLLLGASCRLASIPSSISRWAPLFSPLSFFVMNRLVYLFRSKD